MLLPNLYYRTGREGAYGFDLSRIPIDDDEREKMFAVMHTLTNARIVADTEPLLEFVRGADAAAEGPLGCVGYCMSGQYVVSVAAAYPDAFAAIASYYGVGLITEADDSPHLAADGIAGELYLAFASNDPHVPQSIVDALPAVLTAAGVAHRIEIYPDTEHGFAFPERAVYSKAAAERHWSGCSPCSTAVCGPDPARLAACRGGPRPRFPHSKNSRSASAVSTGASSAMKWPHSSARPRTSAARSRHAAITSCGSCPAPGAPEGEDRARDLAIALGGVVLEFDRAGGAIVLARSVDRLGIVEAADVLA